MSNFNPYEERILRVLAREKRALTTSQIIIFSGISYNTTKSYLNKLNQAKYVFRKKEGNKILWWI
jgi:predicted transcriptional regulator